MHYPWHQQRQLAIDSDSDREKSLPKILDHHSTLFIIRSQLLNFLHPSERIKLKVYPLTINLCHFFFKWFVLKLRVLTRNLHICFVFSHMLIHLVNTGFSSCRSCAHPPNSWLGLVQAQECFFTGVKFVLLLVTNFGLLF